MKNLIKASVVFLAIVAIGSNAYSQGEIGFANNPVIPVLDANGMPADNSVTVGLYYGDPGQSADELILGGITPVVVSGIFNNAGRPLVLPLATGTVVASEIRAWTGGHDSYEAAIASGRGFAGRSGLLNDMALGGGTTAAPNLFIQGGLGSIDLTAVPEPSTIALGILGGLGAMLLLRRRK